MMYDLIVDKHDTLLNPLRVLMVEDSADDAALLLRELRRGGYEVTFERVETADALRSALATKSWDLVISDYTMPQFSGLRALELLKRNGADIPFIMVSGSIGEETAVEAMKAGAHDYLMKDNLRRLLPSVNRELKEAKLRRGRRRIEEENQRNWQRIRALHEIDLAITSSLDLRNRLNILLEKIELFVPIAAASTARLFNPETGDLESLACRGIDEEKWRSQARIKLRGRAEQVVKSKMPVIIRDIRKDERTYNAEIFSRLISYLGVPLLAHGEVLGVLTLYTAKEHEFTEEEVEFFTTLAGQAAIAIRDAELYEQTKRQANELAERELIQRTLKELSQDITTMEVDKLFEKLTSTIRVLFKVDVADVRFLGKDRWEKILVSSGEKTEWLPEGVEFGEGANVWVIKQRRSIAIRDYSQSSEFKRGRVGRRFGIRGFLAAPLIGRQGKVFGVVRALTKEARDFTRQEIELFEQMANGAAIAIENSRLYGELQISDKVKSEFLGVMSHELRTPLNVITGYANLLKEDVAARHDVEGESAVNKIESQAKALLGLINTIMEATKIESGSTAVTKQPLEIYKLVDQLKYQNELPKDSQVSLTWHVTEDLPVLYTDGQKLQSILQHLIDNAIKFTERGMITVGVTTTESCIEFSVTDTGIGIPAENLPSIFEIFKQGDSSDRRSFEGVGLGLYIAKKYAEMLGGAIKVKSKVGEGSTFTLVMPLTKEFLSLRNEM
jgi:signal transduction histidine kinase/DNA-binding response OmpR family regulator